MTNAEILKKAIEKAVENGFEFYLEGEKLSTNEMEWSGTRDDDLQTFARTIIFSHDFAKAFWGEEYPEFKRLRANIPYWMMELTQMVMKKDPIKYLEQFL